jgi:transposase
MPMPPRQETDLTDRRWAVNAALVPAALTRWVAAAHGHARAVDAILHALRTGHASRLPPHDVTTRRTPQIVNRPRVPPRSAMAATVTPRECIT